MDLTRLDLNKWEEEQLYSDEFEFYKNIGFKNPRAVLNFKTMMESIFENVKGKERSFPLAIFVHGEKSVVIDTPEDIIQALTKVYGLSERNANRVVEFYKRVYLKKESPRSVIIDMYRRRSD